jgi:hypothetical protein
MVAIGLARGVGEGVVTIYSSLKTFWETPREPLVDIGHHFLEAYTLLEAVPTPPPTRTRLIHKLMAKVAA